MISHRTVTVAILLAVLGVGVSCTYHPNFDRRPSYDVLLQARNLDAGRKGPVSIEWWPASFPDRIDTIGPSGQEGSARVTAIPTGVALSARTEELLDAAVGTSIAAEKTLIIEVREARSEYRFAQVFITARHIDWAKCTLDAVFRCGDRQWNQRFVALATKTETDLQGPELLERVWDKIALGVAASVVENLPDQPLAVPPAAVEPAAGVRTDPMQLPEELEALKRILISKGLITEAEWEEAVTEAFGKKKDG